MSITQPPSTPLEAPEVDADDPDDEAAVVAEDEDVDVGVDEPLLHAAAQQTNPRAATPTQPVFCAFFTCKPP